ncbi:unnamed protein product [Microthlaspi erraticum]|uniref:NB-ARC domain-containing protein n=1 Tax=Microthlaspi erraticum TaxID=1685480 RepID=A0A6D2IAT2_9BRAS|nr:unnamed protein product [Microthlaspi erraticum]
MRTLQSLLKDADAKKSESNSRNFLEDVKDIVDDAEDHSNPFSERIKRKGIKKRVKRLSCFLVDRRKFASDIEGITKESLRYLIVLDDVWKKEDWDVIKAVFPQRRGSKMIITSRNEGVGSHADPTCFAFRPRILTPEESWKLCESIVFRNRHETEFRVDEELEGMGKKMVTYCGGLPLAVRVLGGLLANKYTVSEWQRVYENIQTQI